MEQESATGWVFTDTDTGRKIGFIPVTEGYATANDACCAFLENSGYCGPVESYFRTSSGTMYLCRAESTPDSFPCTDAPIDFLGEDVVLYLREAANEQYPES